MRKRLCIFAEILVFLFVFVFGSLGRPGIGESFVPELHGKAVDLYVNDILVTEWGDALPFIDSLAGRTMVPLRFYSEHIDCNVEWIQKERKVIITSQEKDYEGNPVTISPKAIVLQVGNRKVYVYNHGLTGNITRKVWLDVDPYQESKYPWRVFVPLRFVSECLGGKVKWYAPGSKLDLFPDITVDIDTVMIAHFIPEGPNDYLIVPGERYGKYLLKMPVEQFMNYWGKASFIYCGSEDFSYREGKYQYYFPSTKFGNACISFVKDKGVVGITFGTTNIDDERGQELRKYYLSANNNEYHHFSWYNIEEFERDFPSYEKLHKGLGMRGAEDVEFRIYTYSGFEICFWEDYRKDRENYQSRGWFCEDIWLELPPYSSDVFDGNY